MSETNNDAESLTNEIETLPDAGGIVPYSNLASNRDQAESQLWLASNIDRLIEAQTKIRMAILKLAQPGDWVMFKNEKDKDDRGKAEIGFAGAQRIASVVGVSFTNWSVKKEFGHDNIGDWYRWEYECDALFRGVTIRVYGRAGSRDKFFGKSYGKWKVLEEIDEGNIKIIGRRAAMKEGTKCHLGLHHMDPDFLRNNGITLESAGGYEFKNNKEDPAKLSQKAQEDTKTSDSNTLSPPPPPPPSDNSVKISEAQGKRLYAILQNGSEDKGERDERSKLLKDWMLKKFGIDNSADIQKNNYEEICVYAKKIAENFQAGVGR